MQGVAGEEEVDRRSSPVELQLALLRLDEDVDVDVGRRTRRTVVGEGEGAAEGVRDPRFLQAAVNCCDLCRK